ncbi:MAG: hypothetical protein F6K00_07315 [Leptolyngbya sp. SIOISBB]|nr:hypothetical protein [Leptolyngbya sp. SIOISBB]
MPTTEIISVNAGYGPHTPKLEIYAQRCDSFLRSDRGLFQETLDELDGTMIHLGHYDNENPNEPFWFCGHDLEYPIESDGNHIRYDERALEELTLLLQIMQDSSPCNHVIFLTDFQFGPEQSEIRHLRSIDDFIELSKAGRIRFNTLYHIKPD